MYYEFYIDQFFLEHLLTGCLLFALTVRLRREQVRWRRLLAASALNAALMTLLVCLGWPGWYAVPMLAGGAAVFAGKPLRRFLGGMAMLLPVTVCFGGTLEALLALFGLPVMAATVTAAFLLDVAGICLRSRSVRLGGLVTVRLEWEEHTQTLRGMVDTGNRLREPLTGRPVSIVDERMVCQLLGEGWEHRRGFYLIPYHSIGTKRGWMRGVTVDRMVVEEADGVTTVSRPVLAIYQGRVSAGGQYQMILHPLHLTSGKKE